MNEVSHHSALIDAAAHDGDEEGVTVRQWEHLITQSRELCESLEDFRRRMTEPADDWEAINDYRLSQVEDMLVQAYRRYERRLRLSLMD